VLYEPSASIYNGTGEVNIVIPENQRTLSPEIKWVIGEVTDGENRKIDEVDSPRSPAEIIQAAFALELKRGGYTIILSSKRQEGGLRVLDLTKTEIKIDQVSELSNLKAKCRIVVGMDIYKDSQLVKKLVYESSTSSFDVKDRDLLAKKVLEDTLQTLMQKAVPDLDSLLKLSETARVNTHLAK
jgi:hypothetical protein